MYEENVVTQFDIDNYKKHLPGNSVDKIWMKFLNHIPANLIEEAVKKGYEVLEHPIIKENSLSKYYLMRVKNASKRLSSYEENLNWFLVCLK
jgi:hypothetical protein